MILVVANCRTGSTTACQDLAEEYGYDIEHEVFSKHRGTSDNLHTYNRLLVQGKQNAVIKIMPNHILSMDNIIPGFYHKLFGAAEKIYYTTRLNFTAQCKSWFTCRHTGNYHGTPRNRSEPKVRTMISNIDEAGFHEMCHNMMKQWIYLNHCYKEYPGELIVLENRNEPYTFNKEDIESVDWPKLNKHLNETFNNLYVIKESHRETIPQ